jgi:DNA helicase IV
VEIAAGIIREWIGPSNDLAQRSLDDVAVLAPSNADVQRIIGELRQGGLDAGVHGEPGGGISVLTMHRAKGLEFQMVVITSLGETAWVGANNEAHKRALLYVGATRARDMLVMTHVGALSDLLA